MRLSTETAFKWIQFLLTAGQFLTVVGACVTLGFLLVGQHTSKGFESSVVVPMDATLTLATGNEIHIGGVSLSSSPSPDVPLWLIKLMFGSGIVVVYGGVFWLFWRLRRLFNVLETDPFSPGVVRDLYGFARLMLVWQGLSFLLHLFIPLFISKVQARTILQNTLGSLGELEINAGLRGSLFAVDPMWWPLWVALTLTILASIFQRAHELREQERALRLDQELTI